MQGTLAVATLVLTVLALPCIGLAQQKPSDEKITAETLAAAASDRYEKVESYTATFEKIERVGDKLVGPTEMTLHFREKPFSVHLIYTDGPTAGREVLYVKGRNDDRMLVRLGKGLGGGMVIPLAVDAPRALTGNRHPITRIGIGLLTHRLTDQFAEAKKAGTLKAEYLGQKKIEGRRSWLIKRTLETGGTRYWHIDAEHGLPIRTATYDKDDNLIEQYTYKNLKLDARLGDDDFDPKKLW